MFMVCCSHFRTHVYQYLWPLLLIIRLGTFSFINLLPEAICCCLQSCCVGKLLLLMRYMWSPSFNVINLLAA